MSKAEFFQQLELLTQDELAEVASRIEELRQRAAGDDITETERRILDERIARASQNPGQAEEWFVVRDQVMNRFQI